MNIWPIILFAAIFGIAVVSYCISARIRKLSRKISPLLNLISIMAALSVFLQLYYTVHQFNKAQNVEQVREKEQFFSRISSLESEIEVNLIVCQYILDKKEQYLAGSGFPHNTFIFFILQEVLAKGDIIDANMRKYLFSAYHNMRLVNNTIDTEIKIMELMKSSSDTGKKARIGSIIDKAEIIKATLARSLIKLRSIKH